MLREFYPELTALFSRHYLLAQLDFPPQKCEHPYLQVTYTRT